MDKKSKNIGTILVIVLILMIGGAALFSANNPSTIVNNPTPTIVSERKSQDQTVSYKGENGKDALTLLKQIGEVEQNSSGLVIGINGRKADDSKKEFWAFYVNGKLSEVGPAEYQTKEGDKIEWKIETY